MRRIVNIISIIIVATLLSVITISSVELQTQATYSVTGIVTNVQGYNSGILLAVNQYSNVFQGISYTSSVYYVNSSNLVKILTVSPPINFSVESTVIPLNSSYSVVNSIYVNGSALSSLFSGTFKNLFYSNVSTISKLKVVGSQLFRNYTVAYPTQHGLIYITLLGNQSVLYIPNQVIYRFYNQTVYSFINSSYGNMLIIYLAPPSQLISSFLGPVTPSALHFKSEITLLGKWNISLSGLSGAELIKDYLIVSNSTTTMIINTSNGKILEEIPSSGTIPSGSLVENNTAFFVVGTNLIKLNLENLNYNVTPIPGVNLPTQVTFAPGYMVINNVIENRDSYNYLLVNYTNGNIIYNSTSSYLYPLQAFYSNGYLYQIQLTKTNNVYISLINVSTPTFSYSSSTTTTSTSSTTTSTSSTSTTTSTTSSTTTSTTSSTTTQTTSQTTSTSSTTTTSTSTTSSSSVPPSTLTSSQSSTTTTQSLSSTTSPSIPASSSSGLPLGIISTVVVVVIIIVVVVVLLIRRR
ncbi:hypothetical protein SUSAZ_05335 [Sulfolobus acidocaldarius SUSAZ]|nr:hypothetical protein SUSAZ_05335 [Sulfolobus acidocaldarius SUSAZ]